MAREMTRTCHGPCRSAFRTGRFTSLGSYRAATCSISTRETPSSTGHGHNLIVLQNGTAWSDLNVLYSAAALFPTIHTLDSDSAEGNNVFVRISLIVWSVHGQVPSGQRSGDLADALPLTSHLGTGARKSRPNRPTFLDIARIISNMVRQAS